MKQLLVMCLLVMTNIGLAQEKKPQVVIQTSAECGMCKEKIESKLNYVKGILFAELDVESKQLSIKYNTAKISIDEIKKIISELGYDADDVNANPESVMKLPACCRPGGMDH